MNTRHSLICIKCLTRFKEKDVLPTSGNKYFIGKCSCEHYNYPGTVIEIDSEFLNLLLLLKEKNLPVQLQDSFITNTMIHIKFASDTIFIPPEYIKSYLDSYGITIAWEKRFFINHKSKELFDLYNWIIEKYKIQ